MEGWPLPGLACAFALATAGLTLDLAQATITPYGRLYKQFSRSLSIWAVSLGSGAISAGVFAATAPPFTSSTERLLNLEVQDPIWRGVAIGSAVLVLLRSKLFQFHGSDVGLDYVYKLARVWALERVSSSWSRWRTDFLDRNERKSFQDRTFAADLIVRVRNQTTARRGGADQDRGRAGRDREAATDGRSRPEKRRVARLPPRPYRLGARRLWRLCFPGLVAGGVTLTRPHTSAPG